MHLANGFLRDLYNLVLDNTNFAILNAFVNEGLK